MNARFERAIEAARALPTEQQEDIASALFSLMGYDNDDEPLRLTPEEKAAIARSREQAARGEFASEEEIEAIWKKYT